MLFDEATICFLKSAVEKDGFLELPAQGNSMFPLIQRGDVCRFILSNPDSLEKGNIVLFHTEHGQLIAHRFLRKELIDENQHYILKGDTNLGCDVPVKEGQLIGKLSSIKKKDRELSVENSAANLWGMFILSLPFLSGMLRKYLNWKNQKLWSTVWRKLTSL
ncbi:S24/S26 family peptidase [Heyndrickxia sp. MSNUG]|uniref:S24/S26 family peptidase n=1 Tax=Heyndrickxia sp. MSNUG TaxID=3136677 RepID=UPI003C2C90F7